VPPEVFLSQVGTGGQFAIRSICKRKNGCRPITRPGRANKLLPGLVKTLKTHNATLGSRSHSIFDDRNEQPLLTDRHALYLAATAIFLLLCSAERANLSRIAGDQTPDNVCHFPLLATMFPQAKFIHIVRDARDCAISAWFHKQRVSPRPFSKHFASFR
jgi:hypothetical protein